MANKRIRVYELARELGLSNKEALELCERLRIGVKSHSSSIEDPQADRVRRLARRGARALGACRGAHGGARPRAPQFAAPGHPVDGGRGCACRPPAPHGAGRHAAGSRRTPSGGVHAGSDGTAPAGRTSASGCRGSAAAPSASSSGSNSGPGPRSGSGSGSGSAGRCPASGGGQHRQRLARRWCGHPGFGCRPEDSAASSAQPVRQADPAAAGRAASQRARGRAGRSGSWSWWTSP
jgi:translation initiation factor IF-2